MIPAKKFALLISSLAALHALVVFAGFFTPYDPAAQNRELPYAPPARIHFVDQARHIVRPFVYSWKVREGSLSEYDEDRSQAYSLNFFVRGDRYRLAGLIPSEIHLFGVTRPAQIFLWGADAFGRGGLSQNCVRGP